MYDEMTTLTDYYNENCHQIKRRPVKKFKTLEDARIKVKMLKDAIKDRQLTLWANQINMIFNEALRIRKEFV